LKHKSTDYFSPMKLVFATNNQHKLQEIQLLLGQSIELLSLNDMDCTDEIPENQDTLEGNASEKAFYIYNKFGFNCLGSEGGAKIGGLNGEQGGYSARYAGSERSAEQNMKMVLLHETKIKNRKARFRTVISLVINGHEIQFEGAVKGVILEEKRGTTGFGYDPIFLPDESVLSFAEMPMNEKNMISHRGRAVQKLVKYLTTLNEAD